MDELENRIPDQPKIEEQSQQPGPPVQYEEQITDKLLTVHSKTRQGNQDPYPELLNNDWTLSNLREGKVDPEAESEVNQIKRKVQAVQHTREIERILLSDYAKNNVIITKTRKEKEKRQEHKELSEKEKKPVHRIFHNTEKEHLNVLKTTLNVTRSKNAANPTLSKSQFRHLREQYNEPQQEQGILERFFGGNKEETQRQSLRR